MDLLLLVDLVIAVAALALAVARRPWQAFAAAGPSWASVLLCAVLPLWWSLDHQLGVAVLPPLSGAALLVLVTGWPLAVLSCVPIALVAVLGGPLDAAEALHRAVWLGIVPATVALAVGGMARRWLPRHVGVYVFARGYLGCGVAVWLAGTLGAALAAPAAADAGIARLLMALGEATVSGAIVTLLVAHRPEALATYSERSHLGE